MSGSNGSADPNPGGFRPAEEVPRPENLTVDGALDRLRARRKQARPARQAAPEEAPAEHPQEPDANPLAYEDGNPLAEPARQDHAAPPEEGGEEGEAGNGADADPSVTVTIDGQAQPVRLSELIAGYLRQSDYSRKTQATAAQQQDVAQAIKAYTELRGQLEQRLQRFTTEAMKEFSQPVDWVAMARSDPIGWAEKRARFDQLKEAEAEQQRVAGERAQEDTLRKKQMLQYGHQVLSQAIPGWKDDATRRKLAGTMRDYAISVGYTPDELAAEILDPRQLIVLHEAAQFRALQGRKVTPQPTPGGAPLSRGAAPAPQPARQVQMAERNFHAAPTVDSALAVLRAKRESARRG